MENLINYLLQFGQLNQQQIDLIKSNAKVIEPHPRSRGVAPRAHYRSGCTRHPLDYESSTTKETYTPIPPTRSYIPRQLCPPPKKNWGPQQAGTPILE
jgi:hypothetical protein